MARLLSLAHSLVGGVIRQGDSVIDATCGNGWDTLFLARRVLSKTSGSVYGFDIQQVALENTFKKLSLEFSESELQRVYLFHQNHSLFPAVILEGSVSAIMYNLGYLPGGNKEIITRPTHTILSLRSGKQLLKTGGIMTIMCYRGHDGGIDETNAVLEETSTFDRNFWEVRTYDIQKSSSTPLLVCVCRRDI